MGAFLRMFVFGWVVLAIGTASAVADEPFQFPEGRHGQGELRYIRGIPVLTVAGTPEEMGEQIGVLALKPAHAVVEHFREYLQKKGLDRALPLVITASKALFERFPDEYRREIDAMIHAAGEDRDLILLGNTVFELKQLVGCSGLLVGPQRSATGGTLYGRNFDFPFDDMIAEFSLIVVYRPAGKKAFVMVTFPGLLASSCGMNEDGLTLGANTVTNTADGSPSYDPEGTPYCIAARYVMESLGSLEEFDPWIRKEPRTGMGLLLACDPKGQRVYEITTKNVGVREPDNGLLYATNHFRVAPMAVDSTCRRYEKLSKSRDLDRLAVADVAQLLQDVNQGPRTIQTMVFEPDRRIIHLSIGRGPTSARPLTTVELGPLLRGER